MAVTPQGQLKRRESEHLRKNATEFGRKPFASRVFDAISLLHSVSFPDLARRMTKDPARPALILLLLVCVGLLGEVDYQMIPPLLPLLASQRVLTLNDALAASRRTYLARVEY